VLLELVPDIPDFFEQGEFCGEEYARKFFVSLCGAFPAFDYRGSDAG
jgi:hypothetical protein